MAPMKDTTQTNIETSGRAAVLTYTMPVWATMFAAIIGYEKVNLSVIISLILGMSGIIFLSFENFIFLYFLL